MSSNEDQGGAGRREVAYRLFAAEFDDADFSYSESDEERAPNYVVTPTGARVNRVFLVGVLTEVETVSEDYLRARVVDPSGPFVVYAGQYQPEALAFLESAEPPTFVAVTGKARTYQPDDSDQVYTSVRPESISEVDAETRDRWVVQTAEQTIDRVARAAEAKTSELTGDDLRAALEDHGVGESLAAGIPIALERYGTTGDYLAAVRDLATDAARVVAGERDEVESLTTRPGQGGDDRLAELVERPIEAEPDVAEATETAADETGGVDESTPDETADDQRAGTAEATTSQRADDSDAPSIDETEVEETGDDASATAEEGAASASESNVEETAEDTSSETTTTESTEGEEATTGADSTQSSTSTTDTDPISDDDGGEDLGDFDPEFDLDEEEREEIESEYGTEFQSGTEVDEPGSADIDTPDPDELEAEAEAGSGADPVVETESSGADSGGSATGEATSEDDETPSTDEVSEPADTAEPANPDEAAEDVDLEDAVMDAMGDLDDGDGAERAAIVDAVVDRTGSDPDAVEDAIQEALMGGRCYEPDDDLLKPI
jgi:RPA family protein